MIPHKKTKIVATIGPATETVEMLTKLKKAGMNVCRLNFSHGDHAEHQQKIDNIRKVRKDTGRPLAILQDLSGPKIRTGEFGTESGRITLKKGKTFTFTTEKIVGDETKVYVNYPTLPKELKKGNIVLVDDGKKKLEVIKTTEKEVVCKVLVGGETKGRRGVNLPGAYLKVSSLTKKDKKDLEFGVKNKVDYIALSFVRRPEDIKELRTILKRKKLDAQIIAKIETQEAIENLEAIITETDGVMVARGDLAIEIPAEQVPLIQKEIIERCNALGKPVITATQMLESMINSPVPTRAEVSDVANAILDGTDAVMLSEETTLGEYSVEAVEVMTKVALEIEANTGVDIALNKHEGEGYVDVADSISASVANTAQDIGAELIFVLTESGFSARMVSRFKPEASIITATPNERTFHKLALISGCYPVLVKRQKTLDAVMENIREYCIKNKLAKKKDKVVVVAGVPFNDLAIPTNMLLVEEI